MSLYIKILRVERSSSDHRIIVTRRICFNQNAQGTFTQFKNYKMDFNFIILPFLGNIIFNFNRSRLRKRNATRTNWSGD